ncbi:11192_t:CDS:10, partial [Scutellospora calospora]
METVNEHEPLFLNDGDDYSSDEPDPFLLLSVARPPPQKPKYIILLFLISIFDLIIMLTCTITSTYIDNKIHWDLLSLGIFRIIVALAIFSFVGIKGLGWILGCSCVLSSLYIIFQSNLIIQHKHPIESHYILILVSSFIFSQLYWISYIIINVNNRNNSSFLRNSNIFFEEEQRNMINEDLGSPMNTFRNSSTNTNSRNYGSIFNNSNDINSFIDDGGITNSTIKYIASRQGYNTIRISNTNIINRDFSFSTVSLPIPIVASTTSSVGSARSLKRSKKKKFQEELSSKKYKNNDISEENFDNDISEENFDNETFNYQFLDEKIKRNDSVHRRGVYFKPPHEDILEVSSSDDNGDSENDLDNSISFNNELPADGRVRHKKFVKYPSEMVGNGKWSTLKRKKVDLESIHSKDELENETKNFPLNNNEIILDVEQSNDSSKFDVMIPISSSMPIMSPRTSLLTMAFNSESPTAQATKVDPYSDNSSHTLTNDDKNISLSEANSESTLSKNPIIIETNLPSINRNSFTPKFSSPLAIRAPIIASTDDDLNQNFKQDDNIEEFTNLKSVQNFHDEQKVINIQPVYNQQISSEITDSLLPPIEEEISKSNQNTMRSITKNVVIDPSIHIKPAHSREASNSLQMLFTNTPVGLDDENLLEKTKVIDQKSSNDSQSDVNKDVNVNKDDNKRETILSEKYSLAIKKSWNNEFVEAEEILMRYKDGIPRWCVAFAEVQLVKHLMTGQTVENQDPELINSLNEAEKLATKVCENKDDFETTFTMFISDIWKTDIKPISTPSEDEAEFASLRTNYRWDCELAMGDVLLFRSVLQVIGGSEIKGALNLRRAWKFYSKVRDEIDRIKGETNKNLQKNESSSANSNRWSLGGITSMVRFGGHTQEGSGGVNDTAPGSFLSMLKAFGFNADRVQAIHMLENCYSRDSTRAPFAALFLLINYLFLPRGIADATPSLTRAGIIAKECVNKYPNSSPFLFMACQQARKTGNINEALNYIATGVKSCENVNATSTHYRFEMGMTYLINLDISAAKEIFELLFYGNTIVFTGQKGSIRLQGSMKDSTRFTSRDGSTKKEKALLQLFEFELRPFCGLCLAGCYFMIKSGGKFITMEALDVLKQTQAMTNPPVENNSTSIAGSIGLLGTNASGFVGFGNGTSSDKKEPKANRYNKFAGRYSANINKNSGSPFLIFIILYLRRDIFYMSLELKKRWANMLETIWMEVPKPTDPDINAVYLLIRGVFEKFLNNDPTVAQTTFNECLTFEIGIFNETWVIPYCKYELGELFYKHLGDQSSAMEQFKWVLKGPRPTSRGIMARRDSNVSLTSKSSSDSNVSVHNNPDKFKKYEFVKVLKQRCTIAIEQIRSGLLSPTNVLTTTTPQYSSLSQIRHNRKKSDSSSSLLKEVQQRQLVQTTEEKILTSTESFESKSNVQGNNSLDGNIIEDEGILFNTNKFKKKNKERSRSLSQHE